MFKKKAEKKTIRALIKIKRKSLHIKKKIRLRELYYPSWSSFGIVSFFFLVFFIATHFLSLPKYFCIGKLNFVDELNYLESSHYQNIIAILAGIGAIIFALVIFIAESIRDDDTKDKARVLLRESFLFPLAVAEIMSFLLFIWGSVNSLVIVPVLIIGLLTIYSLSRLIIILLNKYLYSQKREELLKERLRKSINEAIDERLGNNILLSRLSENDIKLEYDLFAGENNLKSHLFKTDGIGIVSDIDLDKLNKAADLIEKEANKHGFSFVARTNKYPDFGANREAQSMSDVKDGSDFKVLRNRYLLKKYHDPVNEDSNVLISVDKLLIKDAKSLMRIDALVKKAFIIRPLDTYSDEVKREIAGIKDQFIQAINNKQTGKIEEYAVLYRKLAESFLEAISVFGGGYSSDQAKKERHGFFGGWEEIRWLTEDIREFIANAINSREKSIIGEIAFLPYSIAVRAIKYKDHYLFQECLNFSEYLYYYGAKEENRDIQEFIFDRSWRYLKEIAGFYIERKLVSENNTIEEVINYKDYAIYFYFVFQKLLKSSFDSRNVVLFEKYKKAAISLFDNFKPSESYMTVDEIQWRLDRLDVVESERNELELKLNFQKHIVEVEKDITLKKYQMLFGLASWITNEFKNDRADSVKSIYESIQSVFSNSIEECTDLFLKTHTFEVEDYWGWPSWDIKIDEGAHFINTIGNIELFYAIKSLSVLSEKTDEDIKKIKLPHNRDIAFLAEGTRDLIKILDDISEHHDAWRFILTDNAMSKVAAFKYILNTAKGAQEQEELEIKRRSSISLKKVEEFNTDFMKEYYKNAGMRSIFKIYDLYEDKTKENTAIDKERFGINIVDDKAIFFEEWYVYFRGWGENYGRTMAFGENGFLIDDIKKDCIPISVEEIDSVLKKSVDTENIIIIASNAHAWFLFNKSKRYKPKWLNDRKQIENEYFAGWYEYEQNFIPIFQICSQGQEENILILNKRKLGKLLQETPLIKGEKIDNVKDIFYINIEPFSENQKLMDEFIERSIDWLKQVGSEDKQRDHLKERVLIQIYERYVYQKAEEFEGYCLKSIKPEE